MNSYGGSTKVSKEWSFLMVKETLFLSQAV